MSRILVPPAIEGQPLPIKMRLTDAENATLYSYNFLTAGAWDRRIYDGTELVHELLYQSNGTEVVPVSDDSKFASWSPSTGADMFAMIDEGFASVVDTDYCGCTAGGAGDNFICKLASFGNPGTNDGWMLRVRDFKGNAFVEQGLVRLLQGLVTSVASRTYLVTATNYTTHELLLTAAEVATITDTTDLHFKYSKVSANNVVVRVSCASLQVPDVLAALKPAAAAWSLDGDGYTFADTVTLAQLKMLHGREYTIEYEFHSWNLGNIVETVVVTPRSVITP